MSKFPIITSATNVHIQKKGQKSSVQTNVKLNIIYIIYIYIIMVFLGVISATYGHDI